MNYWKWTFKLTYYLLLVLLTQSCLKENIPQKIKTLDLKNTFDKKQKVNLSSIAKKIDYIQLQGDSTCYLGQIYYPDKSVKFFNDKILVTDAAGKLLLFNTSGKFLNKIGDVGRGPGENIEPDEYTLLKTNEKIEVCVYSAAQKKALLYSINGNYIKQVPIKFLPTDLTSLANNLIFVNNIGRRKQSDYYALSIVSTKGELEKRLLFKAEEKKVEKTRRLVIMGLSVTYNLNGNLNYWEKDYDTIWEINKQLDIIPKYVIDIGGNKIPIRMQTSKNISKFSKYNFIEKIQESMRFVFISGIYNEYKHTIFYDKNNDESVSVQYKKEFRRRGINFSFYNDIDGGIPFWPMGQVSDNKMFKLIYGYELKDYLDKQGDKVEVLDKEAREKLLKLAEDAKISDNPILMIVTLKE